jgi:hypothetical protein
MERVTICTPHAAAGILPPEAQFGGFRQLPVHLPDVDDADNFQPGLDFSDYSRCHVDRHPSNLKNGQPEWTLSDRDVREVMVTYLEHRCFGKRQFAKLPVLTSIPARFDRVIEKIAADRPRKIEMITRLQRRELCARRAGEDTSVLIREFYGMDSRLRIEQNLPGNIALLLFMFYRLRWTTKAIAAEFRLPETWCRQMLCRLNRTAKSLGLK